MIACGSLDYALARVHARHGQRPDEAAWQRIEVVRELAPLLELARATGLRRWLVDIGAGSSAGQIDARLRRHWRAAVAELAGWMPEPWQPAIAWCALLPELAPLQHLARGLQPPDWMADDPDWQELAGAAAAARPALLRGSPLAPLAAGWTEPDAIGRAWQSEWLRRLPARAAGAANPLAQVASLLRAHLAAFGSAGPDQGRMQRHALQARLSLLLRRAALEPAAAFIHLALVALELERLRGELLRRALFRRWRPV